MYHRASSLDALQRLNAEWEGRLGKKKAPAKEGTRVEGSRIVGPDGDVELTGVELEVLEAEGVIVRNGRGIKLAPGKTIDDVCASLNVG